MTVEIFRAKYILLDIPVVQDELVNLQDASNEVMMIMDDEELVKV